MKILGWILFFLGSNGLTGTLVAKNSIRYDMSHLADSIVERVTEAIGAEGFISTLVLHLTDNLTPILVEMLGVNQGFVQTVNILFYISIIVLILGIALLIIGYIRNAKDKAQCQMCGRKAGQS